MLRVSILRPVEFSPTWKNLSEINRAFIGGKSTIFERTCYDASPSQREDLLENFKEMLMPLFTKLKVNILGVWETPLGERNQVICLIAFDDISKRMELYEKLRREEAYSRFPHGENSITISILGTTEYLPKL